MYPLATPNGASPPILSQNPVVSLAPRSRWQPGGALTHRIRRWHHTLGALNCWTLKEAFNSSFWLALRRSKLQLWPSPSIRFQWLPPLFLLNPGHLFSLLIPSITDLLPSRPRVPLTHAHLCLQAGFGQRTGSLLSQSSDKPACFCPVLGISLLFWSQRQSYSAFSPFGPAYTRQSWLVCRFSNKVLASCHWKPVYLPLCGLFPCFFWLLTPVASPPSPTGKGTPIFQLHHRLLHAPLVHLHLTQQNGRCQPNDDQTLYMLLTYRFTGKFFILLIPQRPNTYATITYTTNWS